MVASAIIVVEIDGLRPRTHRADVCASLRHEPRVKSEV
jgi:hypothetical protein